MFFYLISMSEIVFQFSIDQAGKLALARSPMRVKIWPGEWETGLAKWNLYKLYKRLPSWGECEINLVSQHVDTALTLILVQLLTIYSMHRTRQTVYHTIDLGLKEYSRLNTRSDIYAACSQLLPDIYIKIWIKHITLSH